MKNDEMAVVLYARELMDQGLTDTQVNVLLQKKYRRYAREKQLLSWFLIGRGEKDVSRDADRTYETKMQDANEFKTKITNIKAKVKNGTMITWITTAFDDNFNLVEEETTAKVVQIYNNFALTEKGTVNYQDILEVYS